MGAVSADCLGMGSRGADGGAERSVGDGRSKSSWLQSNGRALGIIWLYAAFAALIGVGAMAGKPTARAPVASLTFDMVRLVLLPILPDLSADPANASVLSTDQFAVDVADYCSGLEGMGLILIFTATWLFYFRRAEYTCLRALLSDSRRASDHVCVECAIANRHWS